MYNKNKFIELMNIRSGIKQPEEQPQSPRIDADGRDLLTGEVDPTVNLSFANPQLSPKQYHLALMKKQ